MTDAFDLIILGGGCAGLSLARELAEFGSDCPSVCVIEQRTTYENDRTWCFWRDEQTLLPHLVQHQWTRARLHAQKESVLLDCRDHPYQMISAAIFYDDAFQKIMRVPQIRLEKGAKVLSEPVDGDGMFVVNTDVGIRRAPKIIDSRSQPRLLPTDQVPILWQSFFGKEISCALPIFDATTVGLMDFIDDQSGRIIFTYFLPLTAHRALIEVTVFDPRPLTAQQLQVTLQQQIEATVGAHVVTVERSESGLLPMGLPPAVTADSSNYLRAGLMHGAARASSGYAFQRIQNWSQKCAAKIVAGESIIGHDKDPFLIRHMDRLFLAVLRQHPDKASVLFLSMFRHCELATLVRFLNDRATWRDAIKLIMALPALPFLRQLGREFGFG